MKALVVSPFVPHPPRDGGRIRIHALLSRLAARHDIELLTLAGPDEVDAVASLEEIGIRVTAVLHSPNRVGAMASAMASRTSLYAQLYQSKALSAFVADRLALQNLDVVQCEFSFLGGYVPARPRGGPPWIVDAHNIEFRLAGAVSGGGVPYRLYARRENTRRRGEEIGAFRRADHVVAVSESDAASIRRLVPEASVSVVPNGVDIGAHRPSDRAEGSREPSAVFVGKMDFRPNVDAARWFCEDILPRVREARPNFRLTICGGPVAPDVQQLADDPSVHVTGMVEDTDTYVEDAAVVVVPLRAGSGTRLKILEAFALGRPVVSTTIGCEGLEVKAGEHLVIADGPAEMSQAVVELLDDPVRREALGLAGRELAEQRYDWTESAGRLESVWATVAKGAEVAA